MAQNQATHYHAHLGRPDKGRLIKESVLSVRLIKIMHIITRLYLRNTKITPHCVICVSLSQRICFKHENVSRGVSFGVRNGTETILTQDKQKYSRVVTLLKIWRLSNVLL